MNRLMPLIAVCLVLAGRALPQRNFTPAPATPILTPGPPGDWDSAWVALPHLIEDGGTLYMFYAGSDNPSVNLAIGLATSTNGGRTWTKYDDPNTTTAPYVASDPILTPFGSGYAAGAVGGSVVEQRNGQWVLYFGAWPGAFANTPARAIGRATAPTPTGPWLPTQQEVFATASAPAWDSGFVVHDSLVEVAGRLRLYYTGGSTGGSNWAFTSHRIGVAESIDGGLTWTRHPNNPVFVPAASSPNAWDRGTVRYASVRQTAAGWEMFYGGASTPHFRIDLGFATSADGLSWQRCFSGPVFVPTPIMGIQRVQRRAADYVVYYTGFTPPQMAEIYRATAPADNLVYDNGCPGSGGLVPRLTAVGCNVLTGSVSVALDRALGGQPALLSLGTRAQPIPFPSPTSPCSLLLSPSSPLVSLLVASLPGTGPGNGTWSQPLTLPSVPGVAALQAFALDPGSPTGFTATNGLQISWW